MTSLIDVIFLLLLFFMLSSTFSRYSEVELSAARTGGPASSSQARSVRVELVSDQIRLNGAPVAGGQLAGRVRDAMQGGDRAVVLAVDPASRSQTLTDVLLTLRQIEGAEIHVVREP